MLLANTSLNSRYQMTKQEIKHEMKKLLIEDIKELFNQLDEVKLYLITEPVHKLVKLHFKNASDLFKYYACRYALALYEVFILEQKQLETKQAQRTLAYYEKDLDKFIEKYELTQSEIEKIDSLPF